MDPADFTVPSKKKEEELIDFARQIINATDKHKRVLQLAFCCGLVSSWSWLLTYPDTAPLAHVVIILQNNLQFEVYSVGRSVQGKDSAIFLQAFASSPLLHSVLSPPLELSCSSSSTSLMGVYFPGI